MSKTKKVVESAAIPKLPRTEVFVQRHDESDDGGFTCVYENPADIDFDQGDIVGVYRFDRFVRVSTSTKVRTVLQEVE